MKKRTKRNSGGQDTGNEGHLLRDTQNEEKRPLTR